MGRMLRPKEVAERLGVTERTVRRWRQEGKLPAHRLGETLYRFDEDVVEQLVAAAAPQGSSAVDDGHTYDTVAPEDLDALEDEDLDLEDV